MPNANMALNRKDIIARTGNCPHKTSSKECLLRFTIMMLCRRSRYLLQQRNGFWNSTEQGSRGVTCTYKCMYYYIKQSMGIKGIKWKQ